MDTTYPFVPKTNSKLRPGHFWPIQLSDGKFGCGIVLSVPAEKGPNKTKIFYAGLLNWTGDSKPTSASLSLTHLKILDSGVAGIMTILTQGEAIEGHIDLLPNNLEIDVTVSSQHYSTNSMALKGFEIVRKATGEDYATLKLNSTWGCEVIVLMANRLLT